MIRTGLIIYITVIIAMISINFWAMGQLPAENIPVHWGLDGLPDRFADRREATLTLWIVPISTLISGALLAAAPLIEPLKQNLQRSHKAYTVIFSSIMLLMLAVHAGIALLMVRSVSTDVEANQFVRFIIAGTAILFIIKGNYLPKTRQNWFLGIRTPWTLSSAYVWERTHRLAGRLFMLAGLIFLIGAFLFSGPQLLLMLAATLGSVALITVVYSYLIWRSAEDKNVGSDYIV